MCYKYLPIISKESRVEGEGDFEDVGLCVVPVEVLNVACMLTW